MLPMLLFALQEGGGGPVVGPARPPVPAPLVARQPCRLDESATEVVVCGSRSAEERYRLKPLSDRYEPKPLIAVIGLNETTTASLTAEQREAGPGGTSQAIMLNFKFLLGGKKKQAK
ncbi:MAG: hypothetical protein C0500_07775 [Sphingobium sp.]|nr:hypothetical protein [Sphingobium sp.]